MYCNGCGTKNPDHSKFCQNCGKDLCEIKPEEKKIDGMWLLVAVLLPIFGLIGGLYFAIKNRKGAFKIIMVSLVSWGFFTLLLFLNS